MRSLLLLAVLAAGCRSRGAPAMEDAPERMLESGLVREAGAGPDRALRRCLYVANHTGETVAIFADGRHVGFVGPRSAAGLYVGRSAGATTVLRATCRNGHWEETVRGPVWDVLWNLRPNLRPNGLEKGGRK